MGRPKIEKCPFCGGKVRLEEGIMLKGFFRTYHIECTTVSCKAVVWFYDAEYSDEDTLKKWNRRDDHGEIHPEA